MLCRRDSRLLQFFITLQENILISNSVIDTPNLKLTISVNIVSAATRLYAPNEKLTVNHVYNFWHEHSYQKCNIEPLSQKCIVDGLRHYPFTVNKKHFGVAAVAAVFRSCYPGKLLPLAVGKLGKHGTGSSYRNLVKEKRIQIFDKMHVSTTTERMLMKKKTGNLR